MSSRAYFYRMRTPSDLEDIQKLIGPEEVYLSGIYKAKTKTLQFISSDLIAAITTLDGSLEGVREWVTNEQGLKFSNRRPYFKLLDEMPGHLKEQPADGINGFRIKGWELPPENECNGDNWEGFCLSYLEGEKRK